MRTKGVEITLRIPLMSPDGNGNLYDGMTWHGAMLACVGKPIILRSGDTTATIGVVTSVEEDKMPYMKVHGVLFHGGTDESGDFKDGIFVTGGINAIGILE